MADEKSIVRNASNLFELPVPTAKLIQSEPPPIAVAPQPQVVHVQPTQPPQTIYIKEKPKTGCLTQIIAGFLILFLLGFIIFLFNSESNSSGPSLGTSSPKKTVKAEVRVVSDGIVVSNADTNTWRVHYSLRQQ